MPKRAGCPPTPDSVKRTRRACVWETFMNDAESLCGEVVRPEAITADGVETMRRAVEADREDDPYTPAPYHAGDSIAACGQKHTVVRALIGVRLSTQTNIRVSAVTQARLWAEFPGGPDELLARLLADRAATVGRIVLAIRKGGMHVKKSGEIRNMRTGDICALLERLREQYRTDAVDTALEHLRGSPARAVTDALVAFSGIGPKVAACVAAFTCGACLLPVDTNVAAMARALGWWESASDDAIKIQRALNGEDAASRFVLPERTPARDNLRADVHCVLMRLGIMCKAGDAEAKGFVARWSRRKLELARAPLDS